MELMLTNNLDSPESEVRPYQDICTRQLQMTGERFPVLALVICDNCDWCYTLLNEKGAAEICPLCKSILSRIPMNLDEVCLIEHDDKRGLSISFDRKLPLR